MKSKNIPADIKSKSIKEAKNEINDILEKFEQSNVNLEESTCEYKRLILLNKHIETLFKYKSNEISKITKKNKKRNAKKIKI